MAPEDRALHAEDLGRGRSGGEAGRRSAAHWLALAYLLFAGGFAIWACVEAIRHHDPAWLGDNWKLLESLHSMSLLQWIFASQNGHRSPLTFLLVYLDYDFLDGQQLLLLGASIVTAWLAVGALLVGYRSGGGLRAPVSRAAFGFAWFYVFWAGACADLLYGLNQSNLAAILWFFLSLSCLVLYVDRCRLAPSGEGSRWLIGAAGGAAALSTFSLAQGVGSWAALIAVSVVARLGAKVFASFGLAAVLTVAVFSIGLQDVTQGFSWERSAAVLLERPGALLHFAASFIGSAAGAAAAAVGLVERPQPAALYAGLLGLGGFAIHASWALRRPGRVNSHDLMSLGLMAFAVTDAALVALTRSQHVSPLHFRYLDWSALFWVGACFALSACGRRSTWSQPVQAGAIALVVAVSLSMVPAIEEPRAYLRRLKAESSREAMRLMLDLQTRADVGFARAKQDAREGRKNLFVRADLPGTPLRDRFSLAAPERCRGRVAAPRRLSSRGVPGAVVRGWVGSEEGSPPRFIVITDASGIIRGLASGSAHEVQRKDSLEAISWYGYIARFDPSQRYEAYGVLSDEEVCRVADRVTRVPRMKTQR